MLARLFVVLVLLLAAPFASAAAPAAPDALPLGLSRYVYGELALAQPSLTSLVITGDIYAYRYDVSGDIYDADEMGSAFNGFNKYSKSVGEGFVVQIETDVRAALQRILSSSFPGDQVASVTARVDRSSLVAGSGNPYDPPVHISVSANVTRTRASVGLGDLSDAAVDAALGAGAKLQTDLTLAAEPGYTIEYAIGAPSGLRWESGPGVSANGASLVARVDNTDGTGGTRAATGRIFDAAATPPAQEDIRSSIDVAMGELAPGGSSLPVAVTVTSEVRALDVSKRFANALPSKVVLPFVNADGIRALRASGAISGEEIASADAALLAQVRADIERAFGPGATVAGGLAAAELARPASKPYTGERPLQFLANATTEYAAAGAKNDDLDLALRIGGEADVDVTLFAANGRETAFTIRPPSIAEFTSITGGTVTANGLQATVTVPADAQRYAATIGMRGRNVPSFTAQDATIGVVVDITDIDAGVGKVFAGDLGTMLVDVTVTGELSVIQLTESMRAGLPSSLDLEYVSSDGIRLLIDRGHIKDADIAKLERELADQVAQKLGSALGGNVPIESSLDRATLSVSLVSTPLSADTPILFKATARVAKPLAGGAVQPQAAIALYTQQLPLTLPKIQGLDTVYTVIAPRGLAITGVSGDGVETGKAEDGRDQFTVTPSGESSQVTVSMAVTPTFVLAKFWPLVLLAVLLLVLVIGTPVALVVMKRRKGKNGAAKK